MVVPTSNSPQLQVTNRLSLTPGLTYSLSILALSTPNLIAKIEAEAAENPLLRVTKPKSNIVAETELENLAAPVTLGEVVRRQLAENNPPDFC